MSAPVVKAGGPDRAALVIGVLLGVLAAVIFWQTRAMPVTAQYARVGPTTAPYVLSGFLAVLAVGHVMAAFRHGVQEREADKVAPMLWIVGGLVAQMLLLKPLGFSIATGLLFACAAKAFGRGPLWLTVPLGIGLSLVVWLIFAGLLKLSLPAGPLESLIF
ncbi:tripartite tricarboxylate transporter TctB family protein [Amaricoccus sp.]|uniref:tripartite tricarboxylate transporter TctB family protein n=1 Tax=Amaricoccus sp. TaxID=1872485 RepID=UPI002607EF00|nr:tripartite tricarboxylate transporter TctB family protein [Amaricoccus sp.]HRO12801.1 tripartite tricarboxylate transporter TctB family protein [Amaricoccus sp.]